MLKERFLTAIGAIEFAKEKICAVIGVVGGAIATAMGGWDAGLQALVIFMAIDYATGLMSQESSMQVLRPMVADWSRMQDGRDCVGSLSRY